MSEDELRALVARVRANMAGRSGSVTLHFDANGDLKTVEYRTFEKYAKPR